MPRDITAKHFHAQRYRGKKVRNMVVPLTIFIPDRKKARDCLTVPTLLSDSYPCTSQRGVCVANYVRAHSKAWSGAQLQSDSAYKETEVGGQLSVFSLRSSLSVTHCI